MDRQARWKLGISKRTGAIGLAAVTILAVLLRIWASYHVPIVSEDSAGGYLYQAQEILRGNWKEGIGTYFPPGLPLLIALLCSFGLDLVTSGKLISVASGAALVIVSFHFARKFYGPWEAWTASCLIATYPLLVISCADAVTEGPYTLLIALLCWGGYRALQEGRGARWPLLGVLFGSAYLIRGEVLMFLVVFSFQALVPVNWESPPRSEPFQASKRFLQLALLLTGFLALAFPYAVYLHWQTGTWQASGKTMENLIAYDVQDGGSPVDYERARMGLTPQGDNLEMSARIKDSALRFLWSNRSRQIRKYFQNLTEAYIQVLPRVVPPLFLVLMAMGVYSAVNSKFHALREGYFAVWFLLPFCFYPLFLIQMRYFIPLLPVAILWVSHGLVKSFERLWATWSVNEPANARTRAWIFCGAAVILVVLHEGPLIAHLGADPSSFPMEHQRAGLWLREHGRPHSRVMNRKSFVSLYSGGVPVTTPVGSYESIVRYARARGTDYLVVDDRYTVPVRPQLKFLLQEHEIPRELRKIYEDDRRPGSKIAIFEVLPGSRMVDDKNQSPGKSVPDSDGPRDSRLANP